MGLEDGAPAWREAGRRAHGRSRGLLLGLSCLLAAAASAQTVGRCAFSRDDLQFQGTPREQAACLLRPVAKYGKVAPAPAVLPAALADSVGQPVGIDKARLRQHLAAAGWSEAQVGGPLDGGLSQAGSGAAAVRARYFVIHDTSAPWLGDAAQFPPDDAPALNKLAGYAGPNAVAHVFVNRLGATLLGHDFAVPWRATKLETQAIGSPARGLFLHIELLQPRRRDPAGGPKNDALAPQPGFTPAQYDALALLYTAASVRGGSWLVPGFHAAIDEGLNDAHDDPQNFSLDAFAAALGALRQRLGGPVAAATPEMQATPAAAPSAAAASSAAATPAPAATAASAALLSRDQACRAIVAGLQTLKSAPPLLASNGGGQTWKQLYDACDSGDSFAGLALPTHAGRPLRCSTDPNRVAFLSRYADGTVVFQAKASVDADGSPVVGGSGWPNDVQTWLTYDRGSRDTFVNAEEVPFIVVPLPVKGAGLSLMKDTGIGKGDLAVVVKGDKCAFGVVGDAGPWFRLGEISLRAHEDLGNPQCLVPGQKPCRKLKGGSGVGIASGVTYLVFPGSRPKPLWSQNINQLADTLASQRAVDFLQANARP